MASPSSASQLALLRNSFVLLAQISDPIFELARFLALWKARANHVGAGRGVLGAHGWPIGHHLADAEFVGWHRLDFRTPKMTRSVAFGGLSVFTVLPLAL